MGKSETIKKLEAQKDKVQDPKLKAAIAEKLAIVKGNKPVKK